MVAPEDQLFNRAWGSVSRGVVNGSANPDDEEQTLTFSVVSIPRQLFVEGPEVFLACAPDAGNCSDLNLSYTPRDGMSGTRKDPSVGSGRWWERLRRPRHIQDCDVFQLR